ncbi:MAG: hypothetical protein J07AB43_09950 [Candidatus Nanosalina sp. J07AB43]|nr:MAG: hypothetical protein J07AB43_09950 [Candidatus Nanosalina sp. J07AB43]
MRDLDKRDYTIIASILVLAGAISAGTMQSNNIQSPQTAENWKKLS